MSLTIPIFKLHYSEAEREFLKNGLEKILDEGFLTNHEYVRLFESEFGRWNRSRFAVAVSNGTTALESVFRALNLRGKDVLIPTNTFIACAVAVLNAGGNPVPCDIEMDYLSIDPEQVAKKISKATGAVLTVHIGGIISPAVLKIKKICEEFGVPLVEDCAHAHGATYNGIQAGKFGVAGAFSFHMTKVMTTGEGGMVVTENEEFYQELQSIRQFGKSKENSIMHVRDGSNFKMTELQALMGVLEIQRGPRRIQKRQQIAAIYDQKLKDSSWKTWVAPSEANCPYYKKIVLPPVPRLIVEETFKKHNIALTGGVYQIPIHRQDVFNNQYSASDFKNAEAFCNLHICPPCYPELEFNEVERICEVMLNLVK